VHSQKTVKKKCNGIRLDLHNKMIIIF